MGGSVWELPTQPQKGVIIASDLKPTLLNLWTHTLPEGPSLPHSTAKHWGNAAAVPQQPRSDLDTTTRNRKLTTVVLFEPNFAVSPRKHESRNAEGRAPRDVETVFQRDLQRAGQNHDSLKV